VKGQRIKLVFKEGKIKKAIKKINDKEVHLNAKAIRKITEFLQKKSTELDKVSYSTRRNIQNNLETPQQKALKLNGSKKHNQAKLEQRKRQRKTHIIKNIHTLDSQYQEITSINKLTLTTEIDATKISEL
jgi:hypothetical protein